MVEVSIALMIFDRCLNVIGLIRDGKVKKNTQIDKALLALYAALSETKAYVAYIAEGKPYDRQREHKLAKLWHEATVPLRHIDKDLANRCFLKGSYWMEPDSWTEAGIEENRIALDQVFESTRDLLLR